MVQKVHISGQRSAQNLLKNVLLNFTFQYEGQLYTNYFFHILAFYCKSLAFQFLSRVIQMHILIPTGIQTERVRRWENSQILITKFYFWSFFSKMKGHLHGNFLFYILFIYHKCLLFQFISRGIGMHIPILTGVQNERISKNAKITHILSIWFFQVASNWCFSNINKKLFFRFWLCVVFLCVSKAQVLK